MWPGESLRNAECYRGFITFKANLLVLSTVPVLRRQAVLLFPRAARLSCAVYPSLALLLCRVPRCELWRAAARASPGSWGCQGPELWGWLCSCCSDDFAYPWNGWAATCPFLVKLLPAGGGSCVFICCGAAHVGLGTKSKHKSCFYQKQLLRTLE